MWERKYEPKHVGLVVPSANTRICKALGYGERTAEKPDGGVMENPVLGSVTV
jgi:hypothetical protein